MVTLSWVTIKLRLRIICAFRLFHRSSVQSPDQNRRGRERERETWREESCLVAVNSIDIRKEAYLLGARFGILIPSETKNQGLSSRVAIAVMVGVIPHLRIWCFHYRCSRDCCALLEPKPFSYHWIGTEVCMFELSLSLSLWRIHENWEEINTWIQVWYLGLNEKKF